MSDEITEEMLNAFFNWYEEESAKEFAFMSETASMQSETFEKDMPEGYYCDCPICRMWWQLGNLGILKECQ